MLSRLSDRIAAFLDQLIPPPRVVVDPFAGYVDLPRPMHSSAGLTRSFCRADALALLKSGDLPDPRLAVVLKTPVRPTCWRSPYPGAVIHHRLTLAPPAGVEPKLN